MVSQGQHMQERRADPAGRTSTSGSSSRNCSHRRKCTDRPSGGWIVRVASSRSKTASAWPACGVNARTGRPWTTTNSAAPSASTTGRASWRRRNGRSGSSTSSAIRTPFNRHPSRSYLYTLVVEEYFVATKWKCTCLWLLFFSSFIIEKRKKMNPVPSVSMFFFCFAEGNFCV